MKINFKFNFGKKLFHSCIKFLNSQRKTTTWQLNCTTTKIHLHIHIILKYIHDSYNILQYWLLLDSKWQFTLSFRGKYWNAMLELVFNLILVIKNEQKFLLARHIKWCKGNHDSNSFYEELQNEHGTAIL